MSPETETHLQQPAARTTISRSLSLKVNFTWTFVGHLIYSASQWGILTVLAKLGSPEMVGQFSLGLAVTAPVIMFTNLQLRAVQATDARDEYAFSDYLGLRLAMTSLGFSIIVGIVLLANYPAETKGVILGVGLAKAVESISDVVYGLLQKHERMDRIAVSSIIKGPLSLFVLGTLVWTTHQVTWGTLGLALSWLALLLFYDLSNARRLANVRPHFDASTLRALIRLAFPLGIVMMLISLNTNVPRYFVEHYSGESGLGYFSAMAYIMTGGTMVVMALGQSASPRLARHYANREAGAYRRLLLQLIAIGVVLGAAGVAGAAFLGRPVLALLYRADYAEYAPVLVWLMAAAGLAYVASFLGYGMTASRYLHIQVPLFATVVIFTTLACFWLVPTRGLLGAAQAILLGSLANLVGSMAVNARALWTLSRAPRQEGSS